MWALTFYVGGTGPVTSKMTTDKRLPENPIVCASFRVKLEETKMSYNTEHDDHERTFLFGSLGCSVMPETAPRSQPAPQPA